MQTDWAAARVRDVMGDGIMRDNPGISIRDLVLFREKLAFEGAVTAYLMSDDSIREAEAHGITIGAIPADCAGTPPDVVRKRAREVYMLACEATLDACIEDNRAMHAKCKRQKTA